MSTVLRDRVKKRGKLEEEEEEEDDAPGGVIEPEEGLKNLWVGN